MAISLVQKHDQLAGSKLGYRVNEDATSLQLTVGGRTSGIVTIKYRPDLPLKVDEDGNMLVESSDLEIPADHSINFAVDGGILRRTLIIPSIKLSHIEIDDTPNGGLDDFWVHISQWGQGL